MFIFIRSLLFEKHELPIDLELVVLGNSTNFTAFIYRDLVLVNGFPLKSQDVLNQFSRVSMCILVNLLLLEKIYLPKDIFPDSKYISVISLQLLNVGQSHL